MGEREEKRHERLKQQLRELEEEWTAMKTGKSSSAVSRITVEEALEFVENSPRNLMLSLQHDPEVEIIQIILPLRRKLFHDSDGNDEDDQIKTKSFSHSSCWSSNVMRGSENNKKKKRKVGRIVSVTVVLLLSWVLVVLMSDSFHLSMDTQINTLVPT